MNDPAHVDFARAAVAVRAAHRLLDGAVVREGSGPVAPTFDAADLRAELSRGKWLEVDEDRYDQAHAELREILPLTHGGAQNLLDGTVISYGNSDASSLNVFVDAARFRLALAALRAAAACDAPQALYEVAQGIARHEPLGAVPLLDVVASGADAEWARHARRSLVTIKGR